MIVTPRASAAHKIRLIGSSATFICFLRDFGPHRACITHVYHAHVSRNGEGNDLLIAGLGNLGLLFDAEEWGTLAN
jgi:hypothetical protein